MQEEAERKKQVADYDLAAEQSGSGLSISAEDVNEGADANRNDKNFSRKPQEAPEALKNKGVEQFNDSVNNTDLQLNNRLGNRSRLDNAQNFESIVHKGLIRSVPLDALIDNPHQVMMQDMPDDWADAGIHRLARNDLEGQTDKLNKEQMINNKFGRMANQDVKQNFKKNKVKPVERSDVVMRVQADTDAIHSKLFTKVKSGDGAKQNTTALHKKRKPIISQKKTELIPIPKVLNIGEPSTGNT